MAVVVHNRPYGRRSNGHWPCCHPRSGAYSGFTADVCSECSHWEMAELYTSDHRGQGSCTEHFTAARHVKLGHQVDSLTTNSICN